MKYWKPVLPAFLILFAVAASLFQGTPDALAQGGSEVPEPESCYAEQYLIPDTTITCPSDGTYFVNIQCANDCTDTFLASWWGAIQEDCANGQAARQECLDKIAECKRTYPNLGPQYQACKNAALDTYHAILDANHNTMMTKLTLAQQSFSHCSAMCCVPLGN